MILTMYSSIVVYMSRWLSQCVNQTTKYTTYPFIYLDTLTIQSLLLLFVITNVCLRLGLGKTRKLLLNIYHIFPHKSANHKAIKPPRSAGEERCAHSATWWQIGEPRDRFISAPPLLSHPLLARNLWGPRTGYLEVDIICSRDTIEIFEEQIPSRISNKNL